jgi:hypothetical protein
MWYSVSGRGDDWDPMESRQVLRPSAHGSVRPRQNYRVCISCHATIGRFRGNVGLEKRQLTMNLRSFVNVNLITASMRSKGSSESLILHCEQLGRNTNDEVSDTHAANKSGLSR